MQPHDFPVEWFEQQSQKAAEFLRTLGNTHRLQVLCLLIEHGEMSVGQILTYTALSQSALSQHLAKMRDEGLVSYRRNAQTLYYSLCDKKVIQIIEILKENFCPSSLGDSHAPKQPKPSASRPIPRTGCDID